MIVKGSLEQILIIGKRSFRDYIPFFYSPTVVLAKSGLSKELTKGLAIKNLHVYTTPQHSTVSVRAFRITVGFTRAAGLVTEPPPQEQLRARVAADFERR